jgi:Rrf2 family protein
MKLSTKGRYGLKAIFDLALHYEEQPISLSAIAERCDISLSYLEQLISQLKKYGVVSSVRGAQGGYILNGQPKDVTVGKVLRALEQLAPVDCVTDDFDCESSDFCVTRVVYQKILDAILETVDNITIQDMIDDFKTKNNNGTWIENIKLFC